MKDWLFLNAAPALQNAIQALCWMLIHSLWQGLLLTIVAGIVMLLTKKATAATRYVLIALLFFIFLVVCGWTFIHEWNSASSNNTASLINTLSVTTVLQDYGISHLSAVLAQYCSANASFIVAVWFVVFGIRCWQMGRAFQYIRRVRTHEHEEPGAYWKHKVNTLAQQLDIRRTVLLLESGITQIPVVIGHLKPVIYMPLGLLANLPPDQIEAVLLHELAHIRRHDFVVNLLQNVAVTVFFFNPGLLWVSSLLKQEREHCCDDIALGHTHKKKQFIEALISFKEHALYGTAYATAFPGTKNQLLQRVTRIIQNRNNSLSGPEKIFFMVSLLVLGLLLSTLGNKKSPVAHVSAKETFVMVPTDVLVDSVQGKERGTLRENKPCVPRKKATVPPVLVHAPAEQITHDIVKEEPAIYTAAISTNPVYPAIAAVEPTAAATRRMESRSAALTDQQQAERDRAQAILDRQQAVKDQEQAVRDREQAVRDRMQADKDRAQAELDRKQADKDRIQAIRDREQADRDRKQAEKDRASASSQAG